MPEMDWQSKPLSAEWREAESKLWLARRSPAMLESAEASCGMPGYFRITYAVAEETFTEGVKRIRQRLDLLQCG